MNSENDFQDVGKKMPYQVPGGFFGHVTGETLKKAYHREKSRRKKILLFSLTAAASLAAALVTGMLLFSPEPVTTSGPASHQNTENIIPDEIWKENLPQKITQVEVSGKPAPVKTDPGGESPSAGEEIGEILASLSDDELLEWAITLKTDFFINSSVNDLP